MNIQGITPSFYRYNLDAALDEPGSPLPGAKQDYLFVDMVMGVKPPQTAVRAPQDIGELKHPLADEKNAAPKTENTINVPSIEEAARSSTADHAQRYRMFSRLNLLESRKKMEDSVRLVKRQRKGCPYCADDRMCAKVFIRCGERAQFSMRESASQQVMAHSCNYAPHSRPGGVLIVDGDAHLSEFCKQTITLFLRRDGAEIQTTDSAAQAIELLKQSKVAGRRFGLVIVDASLPDGGGYWLVNELFRRNHDVNILLTQERRWSKKFPPDYMGNIEVAPSERFVSVVLAKPFHSEDLVKALKKLGVG
jgi:CheY-like chemotaxis protein